MRRKEKPSPGAALVKIRWDKATEEERKAEGARLAEARRRKLTPEQRKEIARKAGLASAAVRWGFKEEEQKAVVEKARQSDQDPELVKAPRHEIASTAAKARWARVRAAKQDVQMPEGTKRKRRKN